MPPPRLVILLVAGASDFVMIYILLSIKFKFKFKFEFKFKFGMLSAKRNGAMVVISGRSGRTGRGMVGMLICLFLCVSFLKYSTLIRVLNQCNTAGDVKTYSGCRPLLSFLCVYDGQCIRD